MKLIWHAYEPILLYALLATQNGQLLCACIVPRLMHNLYIYNHLTCSYLTIKEQQLSKMQLAYSYVILEDQD